MRCNVMWCRQRCRAMAMSKHTKTNKKKHKEMGNGFGYGLHTGEDVSRTMSARYHKDGADILVKQESWKNPRKLTPFEAMGLMGFSKRYSKLFGHKDYFPQIVSDTTAYRQFGKPL